MQRSSQLVENSVIVNSYFYSCGLNNNKTLRSVHFGVVVVELINCKCGGMVRNQIW